MHKEQNALGGGMGGLFSQGTVSFVHNKSKRFSVQLEILILWNCQCPNSTDTSV